MSIFDKCHAFKRADEVKGAGFYPYFRAIEESEGPIVRIEGRPIVMAGSNNYLGLTTHPHVTQAAAAALAKYGTSCSGSRYLTGTINLHEELERRLATFMGKEACLLFSTGYQTGQGVIATLAGKGDYIISDRDNHASIVQGNLLATAMGAQVKRFKHNDTNDLERVLSSLPQYTNKLIVADGVFSTFGTVVALPQLYELARHYNAQVLLDDAHALGVIGKGGRGTASEFDLTDQIDLTICTFSKTLASLGGFVVGSERVINYIKHLSPALIFSASPTPASVAAALAALDVLEANPHMVSQVVTNADYVRKGLQSMGFDVPNGRTAIVPVFIGDDTKTFSMWKMLYEAGIFVNAFVSPATPPGKQMLRCSFMATHQVAHLDSVLDAFYTVGKQLGIVTARQPAAV